MTWQYENKPLNYIKNLLESHPNHVHKSVLEYTAYMAYKVAIEFEKIVDERFIRQYLEYQLPYDALSELFLKASVVYCQDEMYSYSHKEWLQQLIKAKQSWAYEKNNRKTFNTIITSYNELQTLAKMTTLDVA